MSLNNTWERIRGNHLIKHVVILSGGTALGQLLTVAILPILTRLYSPSDFAVFAIYASLLSICSVAASLRLDLAIPIPAEDLDAANITALAMAFTLAVAAIIAVLAILFGPSLAVLLKKEEIAPYLWLVPIGVLLASSYSISQYWVTRKKKFKLIATTRVAQASAAATIQVGAGALWGTPLGLIFGHIVNNGAGVVGLVIKSWRDDRRVFAQVDVSGMRLALSKYRRFPQYSALEALANSAAIHLPIVLIAAYAVGPEAGYLVLAMQVMQAPMAFIGNAVAQVYLGDAPERLRQGQLAEFTATMLRGLLKTGVGPLLFAGVVAPPAFSILFGSDWYRSGQLVSWMTAWFVMQFLVSPVSMALHVADKQFTALCLQLLGLLLRVGAVIFAALIGQAYISELYALSGFLFYTLYLIVVLVAIRVPIKLLFSRFGGVLFMLSAWLLLGALTRWVLVRI